MMDQSMIVIERARRRGLNNCSEVISVRLELIGAMQVGVMDLQ